MAVTINRGLQMDQFRQDRCLTDVELVSETVSLHCHKLVLSLHSSYFRNRVHPIGHRFSDGYTNAKIYSNHRLLTVLKRNICIPFPFNTVRRKQLFECVLTWFAPSHFAIFIATLHCFHLV